jgi:hypothetical protein
LARLQLNASDKVVGSTRTNGKVAGLFLPEVKPVFGYPKFPYQPNSNLILAAKLLLAILRKAKSDFSVPKNSLKILTGMRAG